MSIQNEHATKRLYQNLVEMVGNKGINMGNIVSITVNLMILSERSGMKGPIKKEMVLQAIMKYISENVDTSTEEGRELLLFARITLPSMIETFVGLDKGKMLISVKKCWKGCCGAVEADLQPVE